MKKMEKNIKGEGKFFFKRFFSLFSLDKGKKKKV